MMFILLVQRLRQVMFAAGIVCGLVVATASAIQIVDYDSTLGTLPTDQGWSAFEIDTTGSIDGTPPGSAAANANAAIVSVDSIDTLRVRDWISDGDFNLPSYFYPWSTADQMLLANNGLTLTFETQLLNSGGTNLRFGLNETVFETEFDNIGSDQMIQIPLGAPLLGPGFHTIVVTGERSGPDYNFSYTIDGGAVTPVSPSANPSNGTLESTIYFGGSSSGGSSGDMLVRSILLEAGDTPPVPTLFVDRDSGNVKLDNTTLTPFDIAGYAITSSFGGLNSDDGVWTSITETYDANSGPSPGDGSVDLNDEWLELTPPSGRFDLSEFEPDGDGATLAAAQEIDLGNVWIKNPTEDIEAELLLVDGSILNAIVQFIDGPGGSAYTFGDLDFDGDFDPNDFVNEFVPGFGADTTSLSPAEKYQAGDFNEDHVVDEFDFLIYNEAYLEANPGMAPLSLASVSVPEPTTLVLGFMVSCSMLIGVGRRGRVFATRAAGIVLISLIAICQQTQAADLLAHWKLDEVSGTTAVDSSGGGNTGTAQGSAVPGSTGIIGNAWTFGGGNGDHISVTTVPGTLTGIVDTFSYTAWFNTLDTSNGTVLSISDNTEPSEEVMLRATSDSGASGARVVDLLARPGLDPGEAVGTEVNDGEWHFVAFSQNSSGWSLYVDGVEEDSGVAADGLASPAGIGANVVNIGVNEDSGGTQWGLDGLIDDVAVWDDRLSANEVQNLYLAGLNGVDAGTSFSAALSLEVAENTGAVSLINNSGFDFEIDLYRIRSPGNSLDPGDWTSFESANYDGGAWTVLGDAVNKVSEGAFGGSSVIADAISPISLGNVYDESIGAKDLIFEYHIAGTSTSLLFSGDVSYVTTGFDADFEPDGDVDGIDFLTWQRGAGQFPGTATKSDGDANGDGFVNSADLAIWQSEYGSSTSLAASDASVPEPGTTSLALLAITMTVAVVRRRKSLPSVRLAALFPMTAVSAVFFSTIAQADVFVDRSYQLGDTPVEGATLGSVIGSGNGLNVAVDAADGPSAGDQQNLLVNGNPTYASVSDRPGASPGDLGGSFDGNGDYLLTPINLAVPTDVWDNTTYFPSTPFPENFEGIVVQGMQMWVKPNSSTQNVRQDIIKNSGEHGISITENNTWGLVADFPTPKDSGVSVTYDQWAHVMMVSGTPDLAAGTSQSGGALFVNGEVVRAHIGAYEFHENQPLTIGAQQFEGDLGGATPSVPDNFYHGLIDDVEIFVWGVNTSDQDFGTFNAGTDNEWIATQLAGLDVADVNLDGSVSGDGTGLPSNDDVSALIDGWLNVRELNGVQIGDWVSRQNGDLNFDGITDLKDAFILREGLILSGSGSLDFSLLEASTIPEPVSAALVLLGVLLIAGQRSRP